MHQRTRRLVFPCNRVHLKVSPNSCSRLQFSYYGPSSAILMYDLSYKMSRDNNDLLWWAIVGYTEQYLMLKSQVSLENIKLNLDEEKIIDSVNVLFNWVRLSCSYFKSFALIPLSLKDHLKSFGSAEIRTRGCWVRSANATSEQPP